MSGNTELKGRVEQEFVNSKLLNLYHQDVHEIWLKSEFV